MLFETLRTWAEVDLDAIRENFLAVRSRLPKHMKILVTVKANAYGHGALAVANLLKDQVDYFALAAMDEAVQLRQAGITTPMLVLGPVMPADYPRAARHNVALTVSSLEEAKAISACGETCGRITVHFALDTGMSRIGFACTQDAARQIEEAAKLPGLNPEGLFSHFAMADSKDKSYVNLQTANFRRMVEAIPVEFPIRHLYNSAAIVDLEPEFDMVRQGIILYGLQPSDEVDLSRIGGVKPAMSLRSHVSLVKTVPAGTPVSYGCTHVTEKETVIATVMAGYADGVPRMLSGCGEVIIRGVKAPILGRVCMDQFMVDVTHIPGVCTGDTVTIFGSDGDVTITADEVAEKAQTIGYELICGIAPRVPRVYKRKGEADTIVRVLPAE